ncbi:hypothetical protein ADIARSV_0907 [Arcticibacter svalbardensis MN12-7]|uniref:IPExxxVDY family protein n=1 Tax=Arcticibacter svalbardensis MN12-7 TaxID=1150600 RepID=R9H3X8_9SPHI|nr:hypothetical protein ADIARSV_0907 [Arcticibacter svalbardensis MN12-7]
MVINYLQRKIKNDKYQTFLISVKNDKHHNKLLVCFCTFAVFSYTILNKFTLKYELDLDFVLIAVTSSLKDYLLCFKINRQIFTDFARIEDLSVHLTNIGDVFFSRYYYQLPESETDLFLLANKGTEGYLIPEMKNVDYFILIKNYMDENDLEFIIEGLNKLPDILNATEVSPQKIKSIENLIF